MPETVTLEQMLEARERRASRQRALLAQYALPLVSFSMNIAGPVKNSPLIRRGFRLGERALKEHLALSGGAILHEEATDAVTGCEGLYAVDMDPVALKKLTCAMEEHSPLGRLFDMDVITPEGRKLERGAPRRCLICDRNASECARSRAHTVEELQAATRTILTDALRDYDAKEAAGLSVRALMYEVAVTPKPGLVDRANNGSHADMDFYSFASSASALHPYFETCVHIGRQTAGQRPPKTLAALRFPGRQAECDMRRATGGVNTHKGAIYSMGLVCGALGRLDRAQWRQPALVMQEAAAMAAGAVENELGGVAPETAKTPGERFYALYGVAGVRGEAAQGFPAVLRHGLPVLEAGLAQGKTVDEAGSAALLSMIAHTEDTNLIARGGIGRQKRAAAELQALLRQEPYPARAAVEALDRAYIEENLSPGGSADLLALCFLLHFLKEAAE